MSAIPEKISASSRPGVRTLFARWSERISQHEERVFLVLTIVIGALTGLTVVAFILLTENLGARLYPAEGAAWRRVFVPILGALGMVVKPRLESVYAENPASRSVGELVDDTALLHVHGDQPLEFALERMGAAGVDCLPVVARANVRKLEGIVVLEDIFQVYGVRSEAKSRSA